MNYGIFILVSEAAESKIKGLADFKTKQGPSCKLQTHRVKENSAVFNSYKGSSHVKITTSLSSSHLPQIPIS